MVTETCCESGSAAPVSLEVDGLPHHIANVRRVGHDRAELGAEGLREIEDAEQNANPD